MVGSSVCMVTDSIVVVGQKAKSESQPSKAQLSDPILPVLSICKSPELSVGSSHWKHECVILDSNHNDGQVEDRNRCSPSQIKGELPTRTQQILPHSWDGSLHQTLPAAVDQVFVLERMRNCDQWCQSACLGDNGQQALWFLWSVEAMASLVMGVCFRNNLFLQNMWEFTARQVLS